MSGVLLESRPYRPFKSSEEYLVAMREDLAEWLQEMYPHLAIIADNFMEKLETGVPLCAHANAVKSQAYEYVQKKQARKIMARSITGSLATAQNLVEISDVKYISCAKPSTFFARDNVSNFIHWCKTSLQIIDCLLFESDDLIMRKNEKHVILCLLEVARKGAKFGVPAPMLVQMERQIDREIAADQRKLLLAQQQQQQQNHLNGQSSLDDDESDSEVDDEQPMMIYGPLPQIITNDLKSLDEMVRDLVEKCTCPTQFKMIRLSEGKYRIGDTNTLIFVRILRNHVMVRVGGGWDTLSHYLDKHDPCRCRSQHKSTMSARLVNKPGAPDLAGAHVYYDRSNVSGGPQTTQSTNPTSTTNNDKTSARLGPPMHSLNRSRSRSPSGIPTATSTTPIQSRRSVSPGVTPQQRRTLAVPQSVAGNYRHRSRSPTPNFTSTHTAKLLPQQSHQTIKRSSLSGSAGSGSSGPQSLPIFSAAVASPVVAVRKKSATNVTHVSSLQIPLDKQKTEATTVLATVEPNHGGGAVMGETQSDNGSEVSDEGYRSLGLIDKSKYRTSVCSPNSSDDAEYNEQHDSIIDLEDETNDCGLRKTQYSMQIYGGDQPDSPLLPTKKPQTPSVSRNNSLETQKPEQPMTKQSSSKPSPTLNRASPDKSIRTSRTKPVTNGGGTWSGRPSKPRASIISSATFHQPPPPPQQPQHFTRNAGGRMSVGGSMSRRGSQSANTSPIKSRLKDEILKTLHRTDDEQLLVEQVHKLIKQHSSVSLYAGAAAGDGGEEGMGGFRRRRDSRPDTYVSRIPGPKAIA